ncbi:hypothetical protein AGMMS49587_00440 [Spirochaetia bacterium]|nr:hypothetical protein AGMMS49587_00440 [Spirochaetia bacterium]
MIKLIVTDLDGTLLDDRGELSPYTEVVFAECKRRQILIGIATARTAESCEAIAERFQPDILITEDGRTVTVQGKVVFAQARPQAKNLDSLISTLLVDCALSDKMDGIREVMKHLSIASSEIAAFGDEDNDIGMVIECGAGVAVENATQELKQIADYVCESNNDNGVARWIEQNVLRGSGTMKTKILHGGQPQDFGWQHSG